MQIIKCKLGIIPAMRVAMVNSDISKLMPILNKLPHRILLI